MINSSSVMPAWLESSRWNGGETCWRITFSAGLLDLHRRFFGYKLQRPLLRIPRIDLYDGKSGASCSYPSHYHAENRTAAADPRGIRHARRGDDGLAALFVHPLHHRNRLLSARKKSSLAHVFDRDHFGIVLHEHGDGVEVLCTLYDHADSGRLARLQRSASWLESQYCHAGCRLR